MRDKASILRLRKYLAENNLRQWELAARLGIPEATFSRWMTGKRNISRAYIQILKKEKII
jgi:plasmid maintenance system antidote protein VapI